MKKLTVLFIILCITASVFALEEVRGIQTRSVLYEYEEKEGLFDKRTILCGRSENWSNTSYNIYEFKGFELKNDNNFAVSIEIQLFETQDFRYKQDNIPFAVVIPEHILDTKNINLEAGESYVWKTRILATYYNDYARKRDLRTSEAINEYFIKYKAYKIETDPKSNKRKDNNDNYSN